MDAIRPLACRPRAFTTMSLDRRFESVASIEFHDYDYVAENSTLARHDNLPRAPAYMFKLNNVIRASLFVSPRNTSKAVRLVYDPLMLAVDAFPTFRSLLYQRDRSIDVSGLPDQERFDLLHM